MEPIKIDVGYESVTIDKCFGPAIFANLRITADPARGWVIERNWMKTGEYLEWCVIPAQLDAEFDEGAE